MIKKLIGIIFACIAATSVSLGAHAAPADRQLNYIYTDIEENYIADYRLYEQVMYGQIVFYTNISNGDITSDSVVIELPANVETIFERDGVKLAFTNKAEISKLGSYSLTVIAKGEDILGGAVNDRYYGLFRFRIMEAAQTQAHPIIDVNEWESSGEYTSPFQQDEPQPTEEAPDKVTEQATDVPQTAENPETVEPLQTEASQPVSTTSAAGTTASGGTDAGAPSEEVPVGDTSLIKQEPTETNIKLTTKAGTEIFTNIPAGMTTSGKVSFTFGSDVQYKLYRDGAYLSGYSEKDNIVGAGKYQLFVYDGSGALPAQFDFEITGQYISGITSFTVPKGCTVGRALYEGNMIRSNSTSVDLGSEGTYTVDVVYGEYTFSETFVLDNTPPVFGFDRVVNGVAEGGTVTLLLESDDVERYEIYLDGVLVETKNRAMSDPGTYTVKVYDSAGNMSEQSFRLLYKMNTMAVVVILLLASVIIAGVTFFVVSRRKFVIR